MSAFASPAGTDAFPGLGPSTLGPAVTLGSPRRGSLMQAPLVYPQFQQMAQQAQQHRLSLTATSPQAVMSSMGAPMGAAPVGSQMGVSVGGSMGATVGTPMGPSMGVDGAAGALGSGPQADERQVEGEAASNQFAHAAVRLLWGALWEDEQQLQLDSPGRASFIGWGPWGPQVGVFSQKATYEENGNAFDLSGPRDWLPLPECFTRLLCSCGATKEGSSGSCSCSSLPPHGFIPEINRLWVANKSELWLWEVGGSENAVERLTLPAPAESVAYIPLSRKLLPPALRSWYFWDESKLCTASVVAHLDPSGCTDSPPFSDVSASPLHCLVVSVSSCVCLFAMACRSGDVGGGAHEQQQSANFRRGPLVQTVEFKCIGAAPKPRVGPLGAPLELDHVAAHQGSSLVFLGSSDSQQIYLLDVGPLKGAPLGFPQLFKRARGIQSKDASAAGAASDADTAALRAILPLTEESTGFGWKSWVARPDIGNSGLLACGLVPLNPKLSEWLRWGFSLLFSSLGFAGGAASRSVFANRSQEESRKEGFVQLEVDEPRGIVWALGGDSSVSAFIMPVPTGDEPLAAQDTAKTIKTLRLSCKEIEEGLRRVSADWRGSPSGRGRLLGPLLRSGRFRAVSLSVTAPHEGHSIVAILVDAVGGRTYISLVGYRGLCSSLSLSFPLPASLAFSGFSGGPLRLEVRGYRGPIDPLPTPLGSLRCASVRCGVFISAYASPAEESSGAAASKVNRGVLSLRRCAACRNSCPLGAPCAVNAAHGDGEEGLAGSLVEGGRGGDSAAPVIHDQSNSCCSSAGILVCCCCNSRTVAATDPVERVGVASETCSSDVLVAAAPDLRALALLQARGSDGAAGAAAPAPAATAAAAPTQGAPGLGGYFFPVKPQTMAGDAGVFGQAGRSNSTSPSVCNEWFIPLRLKENAGRVLLVSEALPSPSFGVLQQSSTICPSAFDRRKRKQWASLPYRADPFISLKVDKNHGMSLRSSGGTKKQESIYASLPSTYPPSALSDSSAGALCGAPKLLIITNRYVLHLRRQGVAQIYSMAIESLSGDGAQETGAPTLPHSAFGADNQGNFEADQQQHQQHQQRGSLLSGGHQRYSQWRHACLVAEQMCEETNFGAGAMFSVFWQLMVDSTYSLSAFPFTQSPGGGHQQGGTEGGAPSTNLLDKQLGALSSGRGSYFQPPGPPHLTQGGSSMGGFGFFETPFGLGYLEESGRQQQQQNSFGRGGAVVGNTLGGPSSAGGAVAAKEGDGRATALAVAWRMLAGLEARKEEVFVSSDLVREQLTLPVLLQQPLQQLPPQQRQLHQSQQRTRDNELFNLQQQQQQGSQLVGGLSHDTGFPSAQGSLSTDVYGDTFQRLPAGISNTTRGLVLFASRLLRPLLGTPLVEAALLPCGLARDSREQQQLQQRGQHEQAGASRKRGREFEWQQAEGDENASLQGLPACLVGRFSPVAVTKLLMKLACLYEVVDAVYTTLFYAFGQRASLQQQQQQQLSRGPPWGLPLRGAPPHFAALRIANNTQAEGSGIMQPAATELQQQEVIWASISLADAIELSILYGVSKVLITAHEMLTAYQLLMQQAEYSVQLGSSRFVAPVIFDRLLSLTLTDLCMSLESRENFRQAIFEIAAFGNPLLNRLCTGALFTKEELEAQMMFLKLRRKVKECYEQQQSPNWGDVQSFVAQELMPRLVFLPLEGLVSLLDDLRFYDLLVKVVTTKASQLFSRKSRRYTPGRRPKWPSLSADSTHRMADVHATLVASCYRHVGDCLSRLCKKFAEDTRPAPAEDQQQQDKQASTPDSQQESKFCAAALVNACLASDDESLHNYVLDWVTTHGGANFPVSLLQMDGPTADRFLSQYHSAFAIDLGERYAASGLHAQAAKCHNLQGLQQWSPDPQVNLSSQPQQAEAQKQEQQQEASTTSADAAGVLAYDEDGDGFCYSLTRPVWHLLSCWLTQNAQKPSLDDRLRHFSKAKESAQLCMQRASSSRGGDLYSVDRKPKNRHSDMAANSWQEQPTERSLQQIDLNIRMVGLQRALLRDAARVFCFLAVNAIHSFRKERALASGLPSPPVLPVSPDDLEGFCREILVGTTDAAVQSSSLSDFSLPILALMLDLQREVYAPHELMELVTMRIKDPRVADRITPHFPSIAALRLYGQRAAVPAALYPAQSGNLEESQVALDEACMSFLSFAEAASNVLQQSRILSDALRDLLALPDAAVRESCSRSLKRLSVILHIHARAHWGGREMSMKNAEGEPVLIPGFLWPAWRLAECEVPFESLVALYLSYEQDAPAKQQSGLQSGEMQTIFCWIFEQWLTSQDDVGSAGTYVGLLHRLTEAGNLPYFGPAVGILLRSQLTERERAQADAAAQQLTEALLQIEYAMASAAQMISSLKKDVHFVGVRSRLAILKQQVVEYRAALHDRQDLIGL